MPVSATPMINNASPSSDHSCRPLTTVRGGSNVVYRDYWATVLVPEGWTATPSTELVAGDQNYSFLDGVKLTRGNYTLTLLTARGHASGVSGGRFGEVADAIAPWVDQTDPWACTGSYLESAL